MRKTLFMCVLMVACCGCLTTDPLGWRQTKYDKEFVIEGPRMVDPTTGEATEIGESIRVVTRIRCGAGDQLKGLTNTEMEQDADGAYRFKVTGEGEGDTDARAEALVQRTQAMTTLYDAMYSKSMEVLGPALQQYIPGVMALKQLEAQQPGTFEQFLSAMQDAEFQQGLQGLLATRKGTGDGG